MSDRAFHIALVYEITANVSAIVVLLWKPAFALSLLTTSSAQITLATQSLMQWVAGMIFGLTIPLLLSWPTPARGPQGEGQRAVRKLTYIVLGAGEVGLAVVMASQWLREFNSSSSKTLTESGLTERALLGGAANMIGLIGLRIVFLAWKKNEWLYAESKDVRQTSNVKKSR